MVGAGWGGLRGAEAGDNWAKVVVQYIKETSSASEKDKRDCFFNMVLVSVNEGCDSFGKECKWLDLYWQRALDALLLWLRWVL